MQVEEIKIYSLGCRLNALEAEKIRRMLDAQPSPVGLPPSPFGLRRTSRRTSRRTRAVVINTCAVTHEALRQSRQQFRKIMRENPNVPIFVTGCGVTLAPEDFAGAVVVPNKDKFNPAAYGIRVTSHEPRITNFEKMQKKGFVQIGDGCDRNCTYCITRALRGAAAHFPYERVLIAARALLDNGYREIILTGINIADWRADGATLADLCRRLLSDLPDIGRLSLSSLDPAADIEALIDLMEVDSRMARHLHLSVQSGCDEILRRMGRRHTAARIREISEYARAHGGATFSWDVICGFPNETDAQFDETLRLARQLKPTKIHAFPFSARPGTPAKDFPNQIPRVIAKERVKKLVTSDKT